MSRPTVRINTFVKEKDKFYVDTISKMFIVIQLIFGLHRMPLLGKGELFYVCVTFVIYVCFYATEIYFIALDSIHHPVNRLAITIIVRNMLITLLSFIRCKWMKRYYSELNKFDVDAGYRPKVSKSCIWNVVLAVLMCTFIVIVHAAMQIYDTVNNNPVHVIMMPLHLIHIIEVYYFGHLLNLLIPRLQLINYYMESSLSSATSEPRSLQKEYVNLKSSDANLPQCEMRKLMDLYEVVVNAFDYLIESIKWQLLVVIISAFVTLLGFLYVYAEHAIHVGKVLTDGAVIQLGASIVIMMPLFAPCVSSVSVHNEVKKLRELLASRLYENKLDKTGRRVARALIAFSETRDLSFRLLRIIDIDVSLPFKLVGLLVTYLIILLQFEKVINM